MVDVSLRADLIARGAAQWRDRGSLVRVRARAALRGSAWSSEVVEAALDDVLADLDEARATSLTDDPADRAEARPPQTGVPRRPVLVVLPGNIVGPAIASAYCAAAAGADVILKSAADERALAPIVAEQFDALGPPLAGSVTARYWKGGDAAIETGEFASVRTIIAFGTDDAVAQIERRAAVPVKGYGTSYSLGFVAARADNAEAAAGAARDVAMFDQRGCMSPQTIYVEGDDGRALLFARALGVALRLIEKSLPRAKTTSDEAAAIGIAMRRLSASALAPKTHGLDTLIAGPERDGVPSFIVAVEPSGPPRFEGFGRIVVVKPSPSAGAFGETAEATRGIAFETLGTAGLLGDDARAIFARTFRRACVLGEMQRPPFGHRPAVEDFA